MLGTRLFDLSEDALSRVFGLLEVTAVTRLAVLSGCLPLIVKSTRLGAVKQLRATGESDLCIFLLSPGLLSKFRLITHISVINHHTNIRFDGLYGWVKQLPPTIVEIKLKNVSADLWLSDTQLSYVGGTNPTLDAVCLESPLARQPVNVAELFPLLQTFCLEMDPWVWPCPLLAVFFSSFPPSVTSLSLKSSQIAGFLASVAQQHLQHLTALQHFKINHLPAGMGRFVINTKESGTTLPSDVIKPTEMTSAPSFILPIDSLTSLTVDSVLFDDSISLLQHFTGLRTLKLNLRVRAAILSKPSFPASLTSLTVSMSPPLQIGDLLRGDMISLTYCDIRAADSDMEIAVFPPNLRTFKCSCPGLAQFLVPFPPQVTSLWINSGAMLSTGLDILIDQLPPNVTSFACSSDEHCMTDTHLSRLPTSLTHLSGVVFFNYQSAVALVADLEDFTPAALRERVRTRLLPHIPSNHCDIEVILSLDWWNSESAKQMLATLKTYHSGDQWLPGPKLPAFPCATALDASCDNFMQLQISVLPPGLEELALPILGPSFVMDGALVSIPPTPELDTSSSPPILRVKPDGDGSNLYFPFTNPSAMTLHSLPAKLRSLTITSPMMMRDLANASLRYIYPPPHSAPLLTTLILNSIGISPHHLLSTLPKTLTELQLRFNTDASAPVLDLPAAWLPELRSLSVFGAVVMLRDVIHRLDTLELFWVTNLAIHQALIPAFPPNLIHIDTTTINAHVARLLPPKHRRLAMDFIIEWNAGMFAKLPASSRWSLIMTCRRPSTPSLWTLLLAFLLH